MGEAGPPFLPLTSYEASHVHLLVLRWTLGTEGSLRKRQKSPPSLETHRSLCNSRAGNLGSEPEAFMRVPCLVVAGCPAHGPHSSGDPAELSAGHTPWVSAAPAWRLPSTEPTAGA